MANLLKRRIIYNLRTAFYSTDGGGCKVCPPCPRVPRRSCVTLYDFGCPVGKNLALLLKQSPYVSELRLIDDEHDLCGLASDLDCIDTNVKIRSYRKDLVKDAIADADIVVAAGGCQHKPKQSMQSLFDANAASVRKCAMYLSEFNPNAVFCIAKPPVEAMVPLAYEEYKRSAVYDWRNILGVASLPSMIANEITAQQTNCSDPATYYTPIVGGVNPKLAVPVLSQSKVGQQISGDLYQCISEKFADSEEDVIAAKNDSRDRYSMMFLSRAAAIARFVNSVLKAFQGHKDINECAYIRQKGHIGEFLPYMTSIVKLGSDGIQSSHMPKLNEKEEAKLLMNLPMLKEAIHMGVSYVRGDLKEGKFDWFLAEKLQELIKRLGG